METEKKSARCRTMDYKISAVNGQTEKFELFATGHTMNLAAP